MFTASYVFYDNGLFRYVDSTWGRPLWPTLYTLIHIIFTMFGFCWHSKARWVQSRETEIPFDSEHGSPPRETGNRVSPEDSFLFFFSLRFSCRLKLIAINLKILHGNIDWGEETRDWQKNSWMKENITWRLLLTFNILSLFRTFWS